MFAITTFSFVLDILDLWILDLHLSFIIHAGAKAIHP